MIQHFRARIGGRAAADHACRHILEQNAPSTRASVRTHAKAAYHPSQLLNLPGLKVFVDVTGKRCLIVPHVSVHTVHQLNWAAFASLGFKGCVLDKDNTLTKPYSMALEPGVQESLAQCKSAFNDNVVVFSNSAGLEGFDTDLSKARAVEAAIGVPVLQHKNKKPAGGCKEILQRFKCESHEVVVVGDRLLTDIVFGNINGMLTVHVQPFTGGGESIAVQAARIAERRLKRGAAARGVQAPKQLLLSGMSPEALQSQLTWSENHATML